MATQNGPNMHDMPGMDMSGHHHMLMPGMLTTKQMDALKKAKGAEFDHLFLTGMIQHHNGALTMVKDLFDTAGAGQDAEVFNFATDVDSGQRAEIRRHGNHIERKTIRGDTMNRVRIDTYRLLFASLVLLAGFAATTTAQTASPHARQRSRQNPFAPAAAPPLPAGMTGSDASDPRFKLSPGLYDAGETAYGMKHLTLLKKPDAFQLGSDDPDNPKVQKTLGLLGIGRHFEDAKAAATGYCPTGLWQTRTLLSRATTCSRETFMALASTTSPIRQRPAC